MRDLILGSGIVCAFLLALLSFELAPPAGGAAAVIVDPFGGKNAETVIAAANGRLLRSGPWPWIAIGIKPDGGDFVGALRSAGAWFVLSPLTAGGCGNVRT
jgi:hypothetical protein